MFLRYAVVVGHLHVVSRLCLEGGKELIESTFEVESSACFLSPLSLVSSSCSYMLPHVEMHANQSGCLVGLEKANTDLSAQEGSSLLHLAVEAGNVDVAKTLIEHGGKPLLLASNMVKRAPARITARATSIPCSIWDPRDDVAIPATMDVTDMIVVDVCVFRRAGRLSTLHHTTATCASCSIWSTLELVI